VILTSPSTVDLFMQPKNETSKTEEKYSTSRLFFFALPGREVDWKFFTYTLMKRLVKSAHTSCSISCLTFATSFRCLFYFSVYILGFLR